MLIQNTGLLSKIQLMKTITVSIIQTIDVTWALIWTFFILISFWLLLRFSAAILFVTGQTRLETEWIDILIYIRWNKNHTMIFDIYILIGRNWISTYLFIDLNILKYKSISRILTEFMKVEIVNIQQTIFCTILKI